MLILLVPGVGMGASAAGSAPVVVTGQLPLTGAGS